MKKLLVCVSGMLLVLGMAGVAASLPVTVANSTFNELPGSGDSGWTLGPPTSWSAKGDVGVFHPAKWEAYSGELQGTYTGYDGTDVALVYGGDAELGYGVLGQWVVGETPAEGMTYTLSVQAAGRNNYYEDATYRLVLVAGTSDYSSWIELAMSAPFTPMEESFQSNNLVYTASSLDPTYSELGINVRVYGATAGNQVLFDNVSLDATRWEVLPAAVPEPATMLLLGSGLIGVGVYVRKRFKR